MKRLCNSPLAGGSPPKNLKLEPAEICLPDDLLDQIITFVFQQCQFDATDLSCVNRQFKRVITTKSKYQWIYLQKKHCLQ